MAKESKELGDRGENAACEYLAKKGFRVVERNFRSQQGEVDLIAYDGSVLVFIEVKNYSFRSFGSPLGAVRKSKRQSIIHAAQTYLMKKNIRGVNCRFDVVSFNTGTDGSVAIEHIKDAFGVN